LAKRLGLCNRFVVLYAAISGAYKASKTWLALPTCCGSATVTAHSACGDGLERERLKRIAAERSINNVVFIGPQPPETIVAYSALADILYVGLVTSSLSALSVRRK